MLRFDGKLGVAGVLAAGVLAMAPGAASAVDAQGLYLGGGGGLNFHERSPFTIGSPAGSVSGSIDWDMGFTALGAVGYAFTGGPRVEFEISYRQNDGSANVPAFGSGRMSNTAFLANVLYDFDTDSAITPYVGAGLGVAITDVDGGNTNTQFAYQGIAGVGYAITGSLDAFLDYRYFATDRTRQPGGVSLDNQNHSVLVGLRYSFGPSSETVAEVPVPRGPAPAYVPAPAAPPPAPMPQAATAMARSYLVFFDFDRSNLTGEGQRIVRTAAMNTREAAVTRIDVTGHTDRAGSTAYNQKLSMRRAQTVKRELMANGVQERDIIVYAKGETEPLVPTKDGVREPQNRRVEIVLN